MEKSWRKCDIAWFVVAVTITLVSIIYKHIIVVGSMTPVALVSDISAIFGVIYVILIANQERKAYFFGMGNAILYAIAVYNKGLYLSAAYNLLYSFPVLIYGYVYWGKLSEKNDSKVKSFSISKRTFGTFLMIIFIICLALFSENVLNGTNAWNDSIVSVCVCVATFLMAKKYIEQWFLFTVSNLMGMILFFPKSSADFASIDLFVMWSVYFFNSIYGYILWKKSLKGVEN